MTHILMISTVIIQSAYTISFLFFHRTHIISGILSEKTVANIICKLL